MIYLLHGSKVIKSAYAQTFGTNSFTSYTLTSPLFIYLLISGVVLLIGSIFGIGASVLFRNGREEDNDVTFIVDAAEPILTLKPDSVIDTQVGLKSVIEVDAKNTQTYSSGIEEANTYTLLLEKPLPSFDIDGEAKFDLQQNRDI